MLKNYFKIAIRNLLRQKIYSVINITGLALGLTCAIVVMLMVRREYAVNRNFSKAEQIYRVGSKWKEKSMGNEITTLAPVAPLMKKTFPEVAEFNRFWAGRVVLNVDDKAFREYMVIADTSFFKMFDFPFLAGDPATAFRQPNSIVITEGLAQNCFGAIDALGKIITLQLWSGEGKRDYRIAGVLKTLPKNSVTHLDAAEGYTAFISTRNLTDFLDSRVFDSWLSRRLLTFLLLRPDTDVPALRAKLPMLLDEHCPEDLRPNIELMLEPITSVHLTDFDGQVLKTIKGQLFFAVLMILIASINFINLSTARALQRAKEIGVRKVLGGHRLELTKQFLVEAMVFTAVATLVSIVSVEIFIGVFNGSIAHGLEFGFLTHGDIVLMLAGLTLLTGLLAGSYPAFFLSSFHPVRAIRGGLKSGKGPAFIRQILVAAQFVATVFLFIAASVMSRQLHFMMHRDLGFDKENVFVIQSMPREWNFDGVKKQEVLKNELAQMPEVTAVSLSFDVPGDYGSGALELSSRYLPEGQTVPTTLFTVDEFYLQAFDLQLTAGRFFSKNFFHADTASSIVLNRAAAEALALANPVGESILSGNGYNLHVIGVVENFNWSPLARDDRPLAFLYVYGTPVYRYLCLKLRSDDITETVAQLQIVWNRFMRMCHSSIDS